jgi:V-type H+-transporting ATPase subunit D
MMEKKSILDRRFPSSARQLFSVLTSCPPTSPIPRLRTNAAARASQIPARSARRTRQGGSADAASRRSASMSTTNRLNVVPTVTVLAVIKNRLSGAQRGYRLLKKKADALTMRYRSILKKIVEAKAKMGTTMKHSAFALTEAKYVAGEGIKHTVLDSVGQANVRVRAFTDNVAGVKLPRFEHRLVGVENATASMTGLGSGGKQLQNCKKAYLESIELLVELAGLQTAFITLDIAIKTTSRRVNALENVVTPRLENTVAYIKGELDELEREEFFRLKKVQAKKKKDMENAEATVREVAESNVNVNGNEKDPFAAILHSGVDVGNVLEPERDDDVLF